MNTSQNKIIAVLGPTNTGKTFTASLPTVPVHGFTETAPSPAQFSEEVARNIYTNSLVLVNDINNYIVNLPPDAIEEVQSRVEVLERMVSDLSLSDTSLDLREQCNEEKMIND